MMFIKCKHLYKDRRFASWLIRNIQVCINTLQRRQAISNDFREAIVAVYQSGKGYKDIGKRIGVHHSAVKKDYSKRKAFKILISIPRSSYCISSLITVDRFNLNVKVYKSIIRTYIATV